MVHSRWLHAKTPVQVRNGLVTARHPLAAAAGVDVLRRGGNALDAAAAILATGVVQPFATTTIGGGGVYGLLFSVLDQLDLTEHDPIAPIRLHLVAEAVRRCRRIELLHAGDRRAAWWAQGPTLTGVGQEQTAHVCAVDSEGMMVSLTETILAAYGSMVTTPAGMLMNNAMFAFVPVPGYPNSVAPGHRPQSSMSPVVGVDRTGRPMLAAGASGGQRISTAVVQVVAYVLDHGLRAQDAVATPRLDVVGDTVLLDGRFPDDTAAALERRGHRVERAEEDLSTLHFANPAAVTLADDGTMHAGVNPLHLTAAAGW